VTAVRRRTLVLAGLGVALMATSLALPWVRIQVDPDLLGLAGRPVGGQTYWLGALSGAPALVVTDWLLLLGAYALAWRTPRWWRALLWVAIGVLGLLGLLILGLGRDTVPASADPTVHPLAGAWLGFLGGVLVLLALAALAGPSSAKPPSPADPALSTVDSRPSTVDSRHSTVDGVGSGLEPGAGWSARPAWQPWYRRRGPVAALVAGGIAVLVLAGVDVWLLVIAPRDTHDHSGDLHRFLVSAPAGAVPMSPEVFADQIAVADAKGIAAASEAWSGPAEGDRGAVILLRFDSDATASQALSMFGLVQAKASSENVPDIPGARVYTVGSQHVVMGVQGDVLFAVIEDGLDASDGSAVALAKAQYAAL
jgi:hypothetical protein